MNELPRLDFTTLLSQVDFLDTLLEADDTQQQPTQVPAAGYAVDVNIDLREILGDEFMDDIDNAAQASCGAPHVEPGTPAEESDAMSSEGFGGSCDSDDFPFPQPEELKKSAISGLTSCSMLVDRLNKNSAGMDDARAGAEVCASMVGTVDLGFTDEKRFKEWKGKYGSVPEGWEEMGRKKGFSKCSTRLTTALDTLQGSDLEIEMRSISNVLSKIYKMSSAFVGAGMLYQATQAFVYEEMEAKGSIQRTVLLVRALNTIGLDDIKTFWREVCLTGTIPVKFAPRSGESTDGAVIELMSAEVSCEFAWTMFLTGWMKFLSKGQEQDIDTFVWKLKYWATREKYHVLWQSVNSDGSLEDVELWFPREDSANSEMVRGEKLVNGREKLAPTLFERCRQAMLCMHPKFMEKYALVVAQKALDATAEVFEQKEGIPIVADFEAMRDLLRATQRVWKADPVMQGKVPKNSGNGGAVPGAAKAAAACRVCKKKSHKTKDCPDRVGKNCQQWTAKGVCSFGDECVHEHKAANKGPKAGGNGQVAPVAPAAGASSGAWSALGGMPQPRAAPGAAPAVAGKPAWIVPPGAAPGWKAPPGATSMPMTNADVPWTPGKVHEKECRGDACKKLFKETEDEWLGRKLPCGEQLSMPVWCPECRAKRKQWHSLCMELEFSECDQDDREDDKPAEREGRLLDEVDMVVLVIAAEDDSAAEMEGLDDFLAGLKTAQMHITDVGAAGEAEADDQVAAFRWEQQKAQMGLAVEDVAERALIEPVPAVFPNDEWWDQWVPCCVAAKVPVKEAPVKVAAAVGVHDSSSAFHSVVLSEESRRLVPMDSTIGQMEELSICEGAGAEEAANAENTEGFRVRKLALRISEGASAEEAARAEDDAEDFQMRMLALRGRSAAMGGGGAGASAVRKHAAEVATACLMYASSSVAASALAGAASVVNAKVGVYDGTRCAVGDAVREQVTAEVMWMVHRQLRQWHDEWAPGGRMVIKNDAMVVDWIAAMGAQRAFGQWVRQRVGELDVVDNKRDVPVMAVSAVTDGDRREALEVAVKWARNDAAEEALFTEYGGPVGGPGWQLSDELLDWDVMLRAEGSTVARAVCAMGKHLKRVLRGHSEHLQVWKEVQQMMDAEDVWVYKDQLMSEHDMGSCDVLLSMMGTSLEMQRTLRVSAIRRGAGIAALLAVAKRVAAISGLDRRMCAWSHYHDAQGMGLISTLYQGSVVTLRMWARVLAQAQEVTAVVVDNSVAPDKVDWVGVVRSGSARTKEPEIDIQVSCVISDVLDVRICACDEEGMGSCDEAAGPECDDGGQDMGGGSDSVAQRAQLPNIPDSSDNESEQTTTSSDEEDRLEFEKRQKSKFGVDGHTVDPSAVDTGNITEGKRKRTATVVHNVGSHSGGEGCELNDSDEGFSDSPDNSSKSTEGATTSSEDAMVCKVLRRRNDGSPVWAENDRMHIDELNNLLADSVAEDVSEMSVAEWCEFNLASGGGSGEGSGSDGESQNGSRYAKPEAVETDVEVAKWIEANHDERESFFC